MPSAHLKLDDETVSRMHAIIEVNGPGDVSIIDLGSTKGTFVNGQKVNKAKLQSGDTIVVGETRIELAIGAATRPRTSRPRSARPRAAGRRRSRRRRARRRASRRPPPRRRCRAPAPPPLAPPPRRSRRRRSVRRRRRSRSPPPPPQFAPAPPRSRRRRSRSVRRPACPAAARDLRHRDGAGRRLPAGDGRVEADDIGGARAVEVAAMLGDSVVGVKHCIDPQAAARSRAATWALFAVGVATLRRARSSRSTSSVDNAAYNKGRYDYETQRPARSPATRCARASLSVGYDWIAFGGLRRVARRR